MVMQYRVRWTTSSFVKRFKFIVRTFFTVTIPAMGIFLLILEVGVRVLLPVSDVPVTTFKSGIGNHYLPDQQGRFIKGIDSEINAQFRINSAGWNSPHEYTIEAIDDVFRIAVIGDSYVEALQVDYDQSFPYLLEKSLNKSGKCQFEVLSFGHSGANLMQYLSVLKHAVVYYNPDLVVFNLVHNDFQESLEGYSRIDNWSVNMLGNSFQPVSPTPSEMLTIKQLISRSALVRYSLINLDLATRLAYLFHRISGDRQRIAANMDIDSNLLNDRSALTGLLHYILQEVQIIAVNRDFQVIFVMDANRDAIYHNQMPEASAIHLLNRVLQTETARLGFPLLDLTNAFQQVWKNSKRPFEWTIDGHWNKEGHQVVASRLESFLNEKSMYSCC